MSNINDQNKYIYYNDPTMPRTCRLALMNNIVLTLKFKLTINNNVFIVKFY